MQSSFSKVFHDYFSFTWVPEELQSLKKLAKFHATQAGAAQYVQQALDKYRSGGSRTPEQIEKFSQELLKKEHIGRRTTFSKYLSAEKTTEEIQLLDESCRQVVLEFLTTAAKRFFPDDELLDAFDDVLQVKDRGAGLFNYKNSWDIIFSSRKIGVCASGARNGGCYVSFTGQGCELLDLERLHGALSELPNVKITRVDLTLDSYESPFSYDWAIDQYESGRFSTGGQYPSFHEHISGRLVREINEFGVAKMVRDNSEGRTFTVGKRHNGKCMRVYEKGKQLGDPNSPWVRYEVELRDKKRHIPLDVLLNPADYFAGSYDVCADVLAASKEAVNPVRVRTRTKVVQLTYDSAVQNSKRIVGALVNVMRGAVQLSDTEIVEALIGHPDSCPTRLRRSVVPTPREYINHA